MYKRKLDDRYYLCNSSVSLKLFQNKKFLNIHPIQSHLNRKNINAKIVKISPCSGKKTELSPKVALKKACIHILSSKLNIIVST